MKADVDSSPEELSFRDDFLDDDDNNPPNTVPSDNKPNNGKFCDFLDDMRVLKCDLNECIPEYSASEENRNVRSFQQINLPDGKTREIDMKVEFTPFQ